MQKPNLSPIQIWNMSFGFLGIQIGFDLQNGNVSRIFQTLGAEIDALPILWIAAPLTGLIVTKLDGSGKGGILVPKISAGVLFAFQADAGGNIYVPNIPGGGGPFIVYAQMIVQDPAQAQGYALTNALAIEFLP